MNSKKWTAIFCVGALLTGCVSASKFDNLEAQHKKLQDENDKNKKSLAVSEAKITELNGKLGIAEVDRSTLESSVAEMKTAMEEMQRRRAETEKRLNEFKELTSKFSKLVNAGKISVKVLNGRMTVALSTDILFPSGSAKLSTDGSAAIKEVTKLLMGLEGRKYQIEGHTDNVPIKSGPYPSNWELASARALTVTKTMLETGMPSSRISAASYGDTQPIASNDTPDGKLQNRRIAIAIVPDLTGLPGYDELNQMVGSPRLQ